jgi:hypothetical protein
VSGEAKRSEQSQLAAEAHQVGAALGRLVDLARILGEKPDGRTLDELEELGPELRAWAVLLAVGADDGELLEQFTGGSWSWRPASAP